MTSDPIKDDKSPKGAENGPNPDISNIALYNLTRARAHLALLASKPAWTNADTAPFDSLHYDGDSALDHCASQLNLQPGQRVLDVGSGFSATGRFLAAGYGARVTGIEVQRGSHELARLITARNADARVVGRVRSVNADFLCVTPESLVVAGSDGEEEEEASSSSSSSSSARFDHIVSLLCIMHIPASARAALFQQAARFLKPGGKMYVEDFYDRSRQSDGTASRLTEREVHQLHEIVACPYLPSASRYVAEVAAAGFEGVEFNDVSEKWTILVRARAEEYRGSEKPNARLQTFYDTVAEVFEGGHVGGVRLTAVRR